VLIELGLEERPDAITNPWNVIIEIGESSPQLLPEGTKVIDIFDSIGEGRTLLILGEPGSGKTTTLLELTRDLITRAEQDINLLIPVIFSLSSWVNKRQTIADWLVEELNTKYDVPKKIGQALVTQQQLLPLLDGLDEVKAEYREECIAALNQFKQEHGAELVVCSRIGDYESLSNRLNFQSAVYVRSLTLEQICHYLDSVDAELTGLRALIKEDVVLQELAQLPLMLNIMTLAYQGVAVEDLPKVEVVEERRQQLLDDYIERMFQRCNRSKGEQRYSESQVRRWLIWLAQRMYQESQTVFHIEQMQPHWCKKKLLYHWSIVLFIDSLLNLTSKSIYGVVFCITLFLNLDFEVIYDKLKLLIELPLYLSILPLTLLLPISISRKIKPVETLNISGKNYCLYLGISIGWCTILYAIYRVTKLLFSSNYALNEIKHNKEFAYTALLSPYFFLTRRLVLSPNQIIGFELETKSLPNQGIKESARNAAIMGIIGLIGAILVGGVGFLLGQTIEQELVVVIRGVYVGLACTLIFGGFACIQHFLLRWLLVVEDSIPWNYARFLDYAADRIFLQKVGGGYIFIHRMLMEHFAQMELER
jgi:DNA polymerase III delta prime subunit